MYLKQAALGVKKSTIQGYGVFALEDIKAGETVEECYALIHKSMTELIDYVFAVKDGSTSFTAIALGYGSIYNHSPTANADFFLDPYKSILRITALRDIKSGEEVFVNYGKNWFGERGLRPAQLSKKYRFKTFLKKHSMIWRFCFVTACVYAFLHMVNK